MIVAGEFGRHPINCCMSFNREIVVGHYGNGTLYAYDLDTFDADGKWLRAWRAIPTGQNSLKRTIHHSLQVDCESGVGTTGDPQAMLRWSDDGGHTWGTEHWRSMGKIGEYGKRVIWKRLGMTRDRIYEISGTDQVKAVIIGAELTISPTGH